MNGHGFDRDDRHVTHRDDLGPDLRDPAEIAEENRQVDSIVARRFRVPQREAGSDAPDPADEDQQFDEYMKKNFPQATQGGESAVTRRVVVAEMNDRVVTIREMPPGVADPTPAMLDSYAVALIAANDGIRPIVTVIEVEVKIEAVAA